MSIVGAVISALRAKQNMPTVFDGAVPNDPPVFYVVVYADEGVISSASIGGDSGLRDMDFQFRYVANTAATVRGIQALVRTVIIDRTFTSDGWAATFDPDYRHASGLPEPDESIPGRLVVTGFDNLTAQCRRVA